MIQINTFIFDEFIIKNNTQSSISNQGSGLGESSLEYLDLIQDKLVMWSDLQKHCNKKNEQ